LLSAVGLIDVAVAVDSGTGPVSAQLPTFAGEESMVARSARMIGGLLLCLGVFALGMRLMQKQGLKRRQGSQRRLEILEKIAISPKSSIALVALDNKEFLVASGSDAVQILPTNAITSRTFAESLHEIGEESEAFNA
jgi:flagellar biogenesis protein FliO